jgi:maltose alpha-D-glucosyltransferase / alpha-amylase
MLDHLGLFFERALAIPAEDSRLKDLEPGGDLMSIASMPLPSLIVDLMGTRVETVAQLGRRTAELHAALSSRPDISEFAPEPFTDFYRHGLYHGMLGHLGRTFDALRNYASYTSGHTLEDILDLLKREAEVKQQFSGLRDERISGMRIRHHGDFHLGHLQFTGNDVLIMDFDGEPNRPMSERRIKRSAMRDAACMIRSFSYISNAVLYGQVPGIVAAGDHQPQLERWAGIWRTWMSAIFLHAYLETSGEAEFLPKTQKERRILLRAYLIEKCLFEIAHEIDYRPDWLRIPVKGILHQLQQEGVARDEKVTA